VIGIKNEKINKLESEIEALQLEKMRLLESKKEDTDLCEHKLKLDSL